MLPLLVTVSFRILEAFRERAEHAHGNDLRNPIHDAPPIPALGALTSSAVVPGETPCNHRLAPQVSNHAASNAADRTPRRSSRAASNAGSMPTYSLQRGSNGYSSRGNALAGIGTQKKSRSLFERDAMKRWMKSSRARQAYGPCGPLPSAGCAGRPGNRRRFLR